MAMTVATMVVPMRTLPTRRISPASAAKAVALCHVQYAPIRLPQCQVCRTHELCSKRWRHAREPCREPIRKLPDGIMIATSSRRKRIELELNRRDDHDDSFYTGA